MTSKLFAVFIVAALAGCAAVDPYEQPYGVYSPTPVFSQPHATAPRADHAPAPKYKASGSQPGARRHDRKLVTDAA